MNRTGGGRPNAVSQRDDDHAGSGTSTMPRSAVSSAAGRERGPLPTRVDDLPPLPPGYQATLEAGLAALRLTLPPATRAAIDGHVRLLLAWTAAINLTAIRDPVAVAREHVLDSLSALPLLRRHGVDAVLDLGSGGGFPGLPLALALPARRALLVESVAKKARFLATVTTALGIDDLVAVAPIRAEALAADPRQRGVWPAVVARAVASLAELAELAFPLLGPNGLLVAWKRLPLDVELARAAPALAAVGGGPPRIVPSGVPGLEDHVLVVVSRVGPTPAGYPRSPAERARRPW
ncbi:MAG: 16S rRNA (guanine(527)-N(7))-methyltransferase RsmG [Chloroflexota bacterium]